MKTITVEEVKGRIDKGEKLNILDVREPYENTEFNIGGSLVPLGKIQSLQLEDIQDWQNEEIIIYCRSGNRSGQACLFLEAAGYTNVKNLIGGMLEWRDKFKV